MKSFYTLIKFSTNPVSSDQITIGLLLRSENKFYLKFSDFQIKAALRLIEDDSNFLNYFIKQLESRISEVNTSIQNSNSLLFDMPYLLTSDFVSHLSKSSNNRIIFTEPSLVSKDINEEDFNKMFSLFVHKIDSTDEEESNKGSKLVSNIQQKLLSKVENLIHTNYTIDNKIIDSLFFRINLDCIGKNGSIIAAKSIDLSLSPQTIDKYLSHYSFVITKLKTNSDSFYLIADEPESKSSDNYKFWEAINKEELYKVVHSENSDRIANEVEEKGATTFLPIPSE